MWYVFAPAKPTPTRSERRFPPAQTAIGLASRAGRADARNRQAAGAAAPVGYFDLADNLIARNACSIKETDQRYGFAAERKAFNKCQ
jgi:hypothetical protein